MAEALEYENKLRRTYYSRLCRLLPRSPSLCASSFAAAPSSLPARCLSSCIDMRQTMRADFNNKRRNTAARDGEMKTEKRRNLISALSLDSNRCSVRAQRRTARRKPACHFLIQTIDAPRLFPSPFLVISSHWNTPESWREASRSFHELD